MLASTLSADLDTPEVQAYLFRLADLFTPPDQVKPDHPDLASVRGSFDLYQAVMHHPLLRANSNLIVDFLNKGLRLFPDQPALFVFIADMLAQAGNAETAIDYLNRALALAPTAENWRRKADLQWAAGHTAQAEATLRALLPNDATGETAARLARIRLQQGDHPAALTLVRAEPVAPSAEVRLIRSTVFFQSGLFPQAEEALDGDGLDPGTDPGVERLRRIEQVLLAPLTREFHAYRRRPEADADLLALLESRYAGHSDAAGTDASDLLARSDARAAAGDLHGALLCDRLLMARHTGLGDVEPVRGRIVSRLGALGKIVQLSRVPLRTVQTRVLVVLGTENPRHPEAQGNKTAGSLRHCPFVDPVFFYLADEIERSSPAAANRALLRLARQTMPDVLVTPVHLALTPDTLAAIHQMGIPIVLDCHDVWVDRMHYVERNLPHIAFGMTNGLHDFYQSFLSEPEKIRSSPGLSFHPALLAPVERDIAVSFIGTANPVYSPVRRQALDFLAARGIEVLHLGGYAGGALLSDEDYCHAIARSRIVLNFSESPLGGNTFTYKFLKGRSIEAFTTGALLLESHNDDTARWFTPGVHYDTFKSHEELETKLRRYLGDENLRASVAAAGQAHFNAEHHPFLLWSAVIAEALGEAGPGAA